MRAKEIDLTTGSLLPKIVQFSLPMLFTNILQLLFSAADLVVAGRFAGGNALAAIGATGSVHYLFIGLYTNLSAGVNVLAARSFGAGDDQGIDRVVHTSVVASLLLGLMLALLEIGLSRPVLQLMGTPDDVLPLSLRYVRVVACSLPASTLFAFGAAVLRASGNTRTPSVVLASAGGVNVVLNLCFVLGPRLGVLGLALATTISQALSGLVILWLLCRHSGQWRLHLNRLRVHGRTLRDMAWIGIPAAVQGLMFTTANLLIQASVNAFGTDAVSGNTAAGSLDDFVYFSMASMLQTSMVFSGQNYGAGKLDRIRRGSRVCAGFATAIGLILGMVVLLGSDVLLRFYTDSPAQAEFAKLRLVVTCTTYFFCGIMDVYSGFTRGLGSALLPTGVALLCVCGVRVIWVQFIFPLVGTPPMLYLAFTVSWVLCAAGQFAGFHYTLRKQRRHLAAALEESTEG